MHSDEALFERLVAGEIDAFDALYDRFERPLFGFIRNQLGDEQEAEDVFHEAFMAVLREGQAGGEVRSFRAWIYQVARNLCLNRMRARKRAGRVMQPAEDLEDRPGEASGADEVLERCELSQALRRAVERLPLALSEVYHLRAAGLPIEEIAEVLAIPPGTVKSRTHEMIRRLREEMLP